MRQAYRAWVAHDTRAPGCKIDARFNDAALTQQPRLDQPNARAAMNSFQQQRNLLVSTIVYACHSRLRRRLVPTFPLVFKLSVGSRRRLESHVSTVLVIRFESRSLDRLCNRAA